MRFYSKDEVNTIRKEIESGLGSTEITRKYAKDWGRSVDSLMYKVTMIRKEFDAAPIKRKGRPVGSKTKRPANVVTQESDKGVTLRNGFVFDFKPQRAEMHQDHVRLNF